LEAHRTHNGRLDWLRESINRWGCRSDWQPTVSTDQPDLLLRHRVDTEVKRAALVDLTRRGSFRQEPTREHHSAGSSLPSSLQRRLVVAERVGFALAVLAVAAMASARYL